MQKLLISLMVLALSVPVMAAARSYGGGHYAGGHGSSHKGGHYKNSATHDHYRKRH